MPRGCAEVAEKDAAAGKLSAEARVRVEKSGFGGRVVGGSGGCPCPWGGCRCQRDDDEPSKCQSETSRGTLCGIRWCKESVQVRSGREARNGDGDSYIVVIAEALRPPFPRAEVSVVESKIYTPPVIASVADSGEESSEVVKDANETV